MALLIILEGPQRGRQFPLEAETSIIGRESSSDICLSLKAVSRRHALIQSQGEAYFVEDLGSNNGTYISGERIEGRVPFKEGDRLEIGPYVLALVHETDLVVRDTEQAHTSNPNLYTEDSGRKLQVVLEIAQHLGQSVDVETLLSKVLDHLLLLFPRAERGLVLLCEQDHLEVRAQRSRQGTKEGAYVFSRTIARHALKQGVGLGSDDIHTDRRFANSATLAALDSHALLCVPLIGHDQRRLGLIQLDTTQPAVAFPKENLRLLTTLGLQIAVVLENLLLHAQRLQVEQLRKELALARDIQAGFLPANFTPVPGGGYELFTCIQPAVEVSGDLVDCFGLGDGRLAFFLGDVAGKGMPAALFMVSLRALSRHLVQASSTPAATLAKLNAALAANNPTAISVAIVHGVYDPRTGETMLASAGHPAALIRRGDGKAEPMALPGGRPLRDSSEALGLADLSLTLMPGETLILYSDGFTDALDAEGKSRFGLERLQDGLSGPRAALSLADGAEALCGGVLRFSGCPDPIDDLTLLLLRRV